jgi:hypothetical protein
MKKKILKLSIDITLIALILADFYTIIRDKDLIGFVALMFGLAVYIGLEITMKIKKEENV